MKKVAEEKEEGETDEEEGEVVQAKLPKTNGVKPAKNVLTKSKVGQNNGENKSLKASPKAVKKMKPKATPKVALKTEAKATPKAATPKVSPKAAKKPPPPKPATSESEEGELSDSSDDLDPRGAKRRRLEPVSDDDRMLY